MSVIITKKFDNRYSTWDKNPEYVKLFLRRRLNLYRGIMQERGYVFLKDLYDSIGIPITKESCTHGWVKGIVPEKDFVNFRFSQIGNTSDFELVFECYPITNYFETEENVAD